MEEWDKITKFKFPIIFSRDYEQSLFRLERKHGLEDDLSFYVHMLLQEEEIVDSKSEEDEWYEETAIKIRKKDEEDERKKKERDDDEKQNGKVGKGYRDGRDGDEDKITYIDSYSPQGKK